jgi:hypothetical protein
MPFGQAWQNRTDAHSSWRDCCFLQYYFGLGAKLTLDENKKSNILLVWPFSSNKNN